MPRQQHPGLDLGGGHRAVACTDCHDAGLDAAPSAGRRCVNCHEPVHKAPFGQQCAKCHRGIRWVGLSAALGREVHGLTEFPLRGAHREAACQECHSLDAPISTRYRKVAHQTCETCHFDVHRDTLREHGDCAACHGEVAFAPSTVSLDTHANFGFSLEGAHAATACSACHPHAGSDRSDWSVRSTKCRDCHDNPHGTEFAAKIASEGCAGCHTPHDWSVLSFDHTFWPLTGSHKRIGCGACHRGASGADVNAARAQFKGAPRSCEGCHDDAHAGQFRLSQPTRTCDDCHTTKSFELGRFDHVRRTGYALEGKHRQIACAQCHPTVQLRSGEAVVDYRLGYDTCAACHADPHSEPKGGG